MRENRENDEWERHWNTISLGIVTVATAAVGVALFATDLTETVNSWARYCLVIIAVLTYLRVVYLGGRVIFPTPEYLATQRTSKRQLAFQLYLWFGLELFTLANFLIIDAFAGLLASLIKSIEPAV